MGFYRKIQEEKCLYSYNELQRTTVVITDTYVIYYYVTSMKFVTLVLDWPENLLKFTFFLKPLNT